MNNDEFWVGIKKLPYNAIMRKKRLSMGLSQKRLAILVGTQTTYIGEIERLIRFPTINIATQLADILEIDIDTLFPQWIRDKMIPKGMNIDELRKVTRLELENKEFKMLTDGGEQIDKIERDIDNKDFVINSLNTLQDRERRVLELRFGLQDGVRRELEEIGREFGVGRARIGQIEAKALKKIKDNYKSWNPENIKIL